MTGVQTTDTADVVRDSGEPSTPVAPKPSVPARAADERTPLRRARDERGLSQRKLAELLDIPHDTLRKWDRGDLQQGPHYGESVTRLLDFFDLEYEDLWPPKAADGTVAPTLFDPAPSNPEIGELLRDIDDSVGRWGRGTKSRARSNRAEASSKPRRPPIPDDADRRGTASDRAASQSDDATPGVPHHAIGRERANGTSGLTRVEAIGPPAAGTTKRAARRVREIPSLTAALGTLGQKLQRPDGAAVARRGLVVAAVIVVAAFGIALALSSGSGSAVSSRSESDAASPIAAISAGIGTTAEIVRQSSDRTQATIRERLRRADAAARRGDLTLANRRLAALIHAYGPVDEAASVRRRVESIQRDRRARERRRAASRLRDARRRRQRAAATQSRPSPSPSTGRGQSSSSDTTPPSAQTPDPAPSANDGSSSGGGSSNGGGSSSSGDGGSSSDGADADSGFF